MPDYQKMYITLLDAAERAIELLEQKQQGKEAVELLCRAELLCEEIYVEE